MTKRKVPFINLKTKLDKDLSKLFNIIVNYHGLNAPQKVGYCVAFYSSFFKTNGLSKANSEENTLKLFNEAKKSYLNHKNGLRIIVENHQRENAYKSIELINTLKKYLNKDSKEYLSVVSVFGQINSREIHYQNDLFKTIALFKNNEKNHDKVYKKIEMFVERLDRFSAIEIREKAKIYLMDLLTIDSMIGTVVENDILEYFSEQYPVYKTNKRLEALEIDGFINNNRASVKPFNYKYSLYKAVAKTKIEKVLNGAPIIYYKIIDDEFYEIENFLEVNEFYKNKGDIESVIQEIEEVKNLRVFKNNF